MADESMVRTLSAQADAIWPQERPLFARYALPRAPHILDAGCGTGEITYRLGQLVPEARLVGVDLIDEHLERARVRCAPLGTRARFDHRSIFELGVDEGTFDLVVCRHVLQAVPHPDLAIAELARVTKPGGWLHLIAEDYLMINFERRRLDPDDFWGASARQFGQAIGTDLRIGRHAYRILRQLGLQDISIDYVIVDPLRVDRETFKSIWMAWRDGFADTVATHTAVTREKFLAHFEDMVATLDDPDGYGVWHVPVVAGRVAPGSL